MEEIKNRRFVAYTPTNETLDEPPPGGHLEVVITEHAPPSWAAATLRDLADQIEREGD